MPTGPDTSRSDEKYAKQRRYSAKKSLHTSDIAPIPPVKNRERREACRDNLRLFLETYFAEAFPLAWSPGHLEVIDAIQTQIGSGGSIAIAMPRGSGKTTLVVRAAIWAVLYGKTPYAMIVAADATKAKNLLNSIKKSLWLNELLYEDFPEVCHPVRCLNGQAINARKQHVGGELTLIDWTDGTLVLPTVQGSECSGSKIDVMGVTAAGRGAQHTLADGSIIRPSLVLIDDFQTRESAASLTQTQTRLQIINGDILGMKGPDQPLTALAAVTVIYPDDAADQLVDPERCPEWRGVRQRMVESWPERQDLWDQYSELRLLAKKEGREPAEAEAFYAEHREEMDRGSAVAWPERKEKAQSAIQHAYDLKLRIGDEAFAAEYQNEPVEQSSSRLDFLGAEDIAAKVNGRPQGAIAGGVEKIVAAIDVQTDHLWFAVVAWHEGFGGTLLDYGTWPGQNRRFYTKRDLPRTFKTDPRYAGKSEEAAIYAAVRDLLGDLADRQWVDDDGVEHKISRIAVDEGYQQSKVHEAIKASKARAIAIPAKGVGIKSTSLAMGDWTRRKGEPAPRHDHWRLRRARGSSQQLRSIQWDAFYWRAFVHRRLLCDLGDPGCLAWWGENPVAHRLLAAHLDSQVPRLEQTGSREVVVWDHKPTRPDDDLLDCLSMCAVAGSEQGVVLGQGEKRRDRSRTQGEGQRERLSLGEYLKRRKRSKRDQKSHK